MANLTSVGITNGIPTSGTGTVSTIDELIAIGAPISDGAGNTAAITAASTAPVATQKAVVVSISPNCVNANGQTTMANSAPVVIASNQSNLPANITQVGGASLALGAAAKAAAIPVTMATDQPTMPVAQDTSKLFNAVTGTALTPLFAAITANGSGATTIVAAVGGKQIRVLQWIITTNAAVNFKFQSHVTPTDITGLFYSGAQGGAGGAFNPVGHFQTVSGEALDINLSGAVAVGGYLVYVTV